MLSGISKDGIAFFYENPLKVCVENHYKNTSTNTAERFPIIQRVKVFDCSCCPPNLNRVLSSMENYIYSEKNGVYYINQFMESEFIDGDIKIIQKTSYPDNGEIILCCENIDKIAVRIPYWCDSFSINAEYELCNGYAYIKNPGAVKVNFEMVPKLYTAHENVNDCAGKACLMYGPVVYCMEGVDNDFRLERAYVDIDLKAEISYNKELGCTMLTADGYLYSNDELYSSKKITLNKVKLNFIPYRLFANRGESDMQVWVKFR